MTWRALGLFLPGVLTATVAVPATAADSSLAIFPLHSALRSTEKLVQQVEEGLVKGASEAGVSQVIYGSALTKRVRRAATWSRCRDDVGCLVRLGKKTRAAEMLVGRATPLGKGVRLAYTVIHVSTGKVIREGRVDFLNQKQIPLAISAHARELFGREDHHAELAMPALEDLGLPPANIAAPEVTASAGPSAAAGDELPELLPLVELEAPPASNDATAAQASSTAPPDQAETIAAQSAEPGSEVAVGPQEGTPTSAQSISSKSTSALLIGGLSVLGAAAITGGVGLGFGMMLDEARSQADATDASGRFMHTGQRALELERQGAEYAQNANIMFGITGGLAALGGVLVILDLLMEPSGKANAPVDVQAGPGGVLVRF